MALGENLKRLRKLAGLTQGELAAVADMKLGHISKLERNETDAKVSTIHKLMEALNCSANDLLHVKGEAGLSQML
ncbi:helix-turn-helix domain-containing protein, partial [Alcanivorax sp. HI0007]